VRDQILIVRGGILDLSRGFLQNVLSFLKRPGRAS